MGAKQETQHSVWTPTLSMALRFPDPSTPCKYYGARRVATITLDAKTTTHYSGYQGTLPRPAPLCFVLATYIVYKHIQGDSGGICETSGNDSMCDSKQKKFI